MQGDHINLLTSAADGSPARPAANGNHQPEANANGARA
jgi:hypothetical protein